MVDRGAIAVSGQSDGGVTALAVAYDPVYPRPSRGCRRHPVGRADPRAAPPRARRCWPRREPPTPSTCRATPTRSSASPTAPSSCCGSSARPISPPYTDEEPQLSIVERVTDRLPRSLPEGSARRDHADAPGREPSRGGCAGGAALTPIGSMQHGAAAHDEPARRRRRADAGHVECGGRRTAVIVARPPNGTSGATTSSPSCGRDGGVHGRRDAEQRGRALQRRAAPAEATGVTDCRIGSAVRRSASVTTALAGQPVAAA